MKNSVATLSDWDIQDLLQGHKITHFGNITASEAKPLLEAQTGFEIKILHEDQVSPSFGFLFEKNLQKKSKKTLKNILKSA